MKYWLIIVITLLLLSCSEMPVRDNPYDLNFDLPEVGNFEVEEISITCKQLSWDYELDNLEGFLVSRCDNGEWQEEILTDSESRTYLDDTAAVNAEIRYRIRVKAGKNLSDHLLSNVMDNTLPEVDSLTINQLDVSRFLLSWQQDHITGEDGFVVERKIDDGLWVESAILAANAEEFEDNLAVRGYTEVNYRIYCFVGEECSLSRCVGANILFPGPQAAEYEKLEISRIKITWQDESTGEDGFYIDRITDGMSQDKYAILPENTSEWIDEIVPVNHDLQYKIYAFSGANTSQYTVTNVIDNTFPHVIDFAVEQNNVQQFHLSWEQDQIVGESGFELERAFDEGEYNIIALLIPDTEEYTDNICQRDSVGVVHYKIRGYLDEDYSEYSSVECTIEIEPPSVLRYNKIAIDQIRLNWTDNSNGEEGFCIDRKVGDNLWLHRYDTVDENTTNWLDEDVPVDENIIYRVMTYAGEYESDYQQTEMIDTTLPEVTDFGIEPLDIHTFQIDWQQDHICEEEGFLLYRSINDSAFSLITEIEPDIETYTDDVCTRAMLNNLAYRVCVDFGNYISDGVSDSLDTEIPAPDYNGYSRIAVNQLSIHWIDNANGEDGYIIDRSANISGYTTEIGTTGANVEEWIDEDVPVNEIIIYRLRTYAGIYQSTYEPSTAIHNDLPAPAEVNYDFLAVNNIEINWTCNCFGESGYKIDKKVGDAAWIEEYGVTPGETYSWIDEDVEVIELISYRVYIYFEDEISDFVMIEDIDTAIPAPTELDLEELAVNHIQLTWEYHSSGIDGFKIEKKIQGGVWELFVDNIEPSVRSWNDDDADFEDLYRIKAFYQDFESDYSNEIDYTNWITITSGEYTYGEFDEIETLNYDYQIMRFELTNIDYIEYLEEEYLTGDIWVQDSFIYGYYAGDTYFEAGDYIYYELGTPNPGWGNYAQISYDNDTFVINVPFGYNTGDFNNHPVVWISWFGAYAFAEYNCWRLPTEYEWEKAARGLTGYNYPWGNSLSGVRANYHNSGDPWDDGTTPIGYYNGQNGMLDSPSPYGCYDMCGNVKEWTDSWYNNGERICKGGSWDNTSYYYLKTWYRQNVTPTARGEMTGFRCVRDVE